MTAPTTTRTGAPMPPTAPAAPAAAGMGTDDWRLLAEVGLLAGARGDLPAARRIFHALQRCRPSDAVSHAGLAMALLNRRQHDEAVLALERGIAAVSRDQAADLHALHALALQLAGRGAASDRARRAAGAHPLAQALAGPRA